MIVGLTGSYCSGKDTVADYLVDCRGFVHYSLSDELRKELAARCEDPTRENLIAIGTELRRTVGNGVLAERVLAQCRTEGDYVITSIRHPSEVERLKERRDFVLVNVDAPAAVRFKRMQQRKRAGDPDTIEKFLACEARESQDEGPGQQLKATAALAQVTFINDTDDLASLHARIDALLKELRGLMK